MKTGVAYLGSRDIKFIKQDMENLLSLGVTHVCHPYSEFDFKYNREAMAEIINLSADLGLDVYVSPDGIGRVFDGEAFTELAGRNPTQAQVDSHGEKTIASCPNHPDFQSYMREWVSAVCETKVETIIWDNPHFYSSEKEEVWSCRCETCQKFFRKKSRHLIPNSLTKSVQNFRQASLLDFLSELMGLVHRFKKRNGICLIPEAGEEAQAYLKSFAELPSLDEISIKPYWKKGEKASNISKTYHEASESLLKLAGEYELEAQIWIKNFDIQKNDEQSVSEATYAAYNEGVRNIFAMAYNGTYNLSSLRCDDWEKVWKNQIDAFSECQEKAIMNEMVDVIRATNS